MLTEIRDRSSGWFAWIIAALIIIPMAFWGVQEYASTEARPVLAEVGEQKIYQQAFQQQLSTQQQRATQANPSLANSDIFSSDFYKRGVLQSMIDRALVQHVASAQNYQIGDEQLATLIKENPIFQTEGKFDPELYQNYLNSSGLFSKTQFENNIREDALISQVAGGYQESAMVLPDELRAMLEIQAEKRTFDLITVNRSDFIDGVEVTDADIQSYYDENTDSYMEADRRSVEYIELDTSSIAETVEVGEEEVQAAYDAYLQSFNPDETRNTRHILLSTASKDKDDQLSLANDLVSQLRAGADFAELAKQHSDDPGSAADGGSLGNVERGVMVEEFEQATFAAEVGVISDPVLTQFGYHIIQVDSINATEPASLQEMSFDLREDEKLRKAEDIAIQRAEDLRNILFEQPDSLAAAADLIGVEIKSSPLFTAATGSGIASNDVVRNAAFADQVASQELNSELLDLGNGLYVALRQKEFVPSAPKAIDEVKEQIKQLLVDERATKAAEETGASLLARAQNNWPALADDEQIDIKRFTVSLIDTERTASPDVIREVIKMQLRESAVEIKSFTGVNGDFNIVRLTQIAPGDLTQVSQQVKDATRRMLERRNGESLFTSYLKGLEESVKPIINEELL